MSRCLSTTPKAACSIISGNSLFPSILCSIIEQIHSNPLGELNGLRMER